MVLSSISVDFNGSIVCILIYVDKNSENCFLNIRCINCRYVYNDGMTWPRIKLGVFYKVVRYLINLPTVLSLFIFRVRINFQIYIAICHHRSCVCGDKLQKKIPFNIRSNCTSYSKWTETQDFVMHEACVILEKLGQNNILLVFYWLFHLRQI